eukprot:SAG22_NODE_9377_length_592_cov_1.492901_1_plen_168_part_00
MEIFQIKTLRKAIRQNNFDKKIFLGFVQDYTDSIYNKKPRSQNNIDKAIQLILEKGFVPDGGVLLDDVSDKLVIFHFPLLSITELREMTDSEVKQLIDGTEWHAFTDAVQGIGKSYESMASILAGQTEWHRLLVRALVGFGQISVRQVSDKHNKRQVSCRTQQVIAE